MLAVLTPLIVAGVARPSGPIGAWALRAARALQVARALSVRAVVDPLLSAWEAEPDAFLTVLDPLSAPPGRPLAVAAYACVRALHVGGEPRATAFLHAGLGVPVLRVEAYYAIGAEAGAALVPHLAALLAERPELAAPAATLFALRHRDAALSASEALAAAPLPVRRAFGDALMRHLNRVKAVRLAVACRTRLSLRGGDGNP
ncbi:hypothetical protein L6V77_31975 [Myxococcota bacterium]|nr:hypothetical protein [Myxococcota bacterium]